MINLLPLELRTQRLYGRKNRVLIGYVIALVVTALLVAVVMVGSLKFFGTDDTALRNEIEQNNSTIGVLQVKTTDLNKTVDKLETVNKLYEGSISFSELVPKIGSLLPEGTILNGLSLTEDNTDALTLDVDLENPELTAILVRNLVDSDIFEAADIGNITPKGADAGRYQYTTTVKVSFEGSAAAKKKKEAAEKAAAAAKAAENATATQ